MTPKKPRGDGQISGLAGEFFVAAELLKRDIQTSVTFGNAKAIDLFAYNPRTHCHFSVQVKALRSSNYFPIKPSDVRPEHMYVFVLLNKPGAAVRYFIVPGAVLIAQPERFAKGFQDRKFPGIRAKSLVEFEDELQHFDRSSPAHLA